MRKVTFHEDAENEMNEAARLRWYPDFAFIGYGMESTGSKKRSARLSSLMQSAPLV